MRRTLALSVQDEAPALAPSRILRSDGKFLVINFICFKYYKKWS